MPLITLLKWRQWFVDTLSLQNSLSRLKRTTSHLSRSPILPPFHSPHLQPYTYPHHTDNTVVKMQNKTGWPAKGTPWVKWVKRFASSAYRNSENLKGDVTVTVEPPPSSTVGCLLLQSRIKMLSYRKVSRNRNLEPRERDIERKGVNLQWGYW